MSLAAWCSGCWFQSAPDGVAARNELTREFRGWGQIEAAHWFYIDNFVENDPTLPNLGSPPTPPRLLEASSTFPACVAGRPPATPSELYVGVSEQPFTLQRKGKHFILQGKFTILIHML